MSNDVHPQNFISLDSDSEDEWQDRLRKWGVEPEVLSATVTTSNFESCLEKVLEVFPDVSRDYVRITWDKRCSNNVAGPAGLPTEQRIIEDVLDGGTYPKEKDRIKELKRKRDSPEIEAAKWKFKDLRNDPFEYAEVARAALNHHFDTIPTRFVTEVFREHPNYYEAFFALEKADREWHANEPFVRLKHRRHINVAQLMRSLEADGHDFDGLKEEMKSAENRLRKEKEKRQQVQEAAKAKEAREEEHRRNGEIMTCACCFTDDVPISDITHCNADEPHFFCFDCARRNAENDIGSQKYGLRCMDQSRCESSFSREQKSKFLDSVSIETLDRLQQLEEIRCAEMDDLERCPFCDYAAICPSVEIDKEFVCANPDCAEISCRLCRHKSHIPMSCEESKKENGVSQRREIEEARTEALLRTCKKCGVRILKEDGCNKIICTTCYSVICDFCGEDISKAKYEHFDGGFRGHGDGKGKCPLYDTSIQRKEEQIENAGKAAMEKVRNENPQLSEEDLRIKFSKVVEGSFRPDLGQGHVQAEYFVRPFVMDGDAGVVRAAHRHLMNEVALDGARRGLQFEWDAARANMMRHERHRPMIARENVVPDLVPVEHRPLFEDRMPWEYMENRPDKDKQRQPQPDTGSAGQDIEENEDAPQRPQTAQAADKRPRLGLPPRHPRMPHYPMQPRPVPMYRHNRRSRDRPRPFRRSSNDPDPTASGQARSPQRNWRTTAFDWRGRNSDEKSFPAETPGEALQDHRAVAPFDYERFNDMHIDGARAGNRVGLRARPLYPDTWINKELQQERNSRAQFPDAAGQHARKLTPPGTPPRRRPSQPALDGPVYPPYVPYPYIDGAFAPPPFPDNPLQHHNPYAPMMRPAFQHFLPYAHLGINQPHAPMIFPPGPVGVTRDHAIDLEMDPQVIPFGTPLAAGPGPGPVPAPAPASAPAPSDGARGGDGFGHIHPPEENRWRPTDTPDEALHQQLYDFYHPDNQYL